MNRKYLCIDLKTFYASVECVERGLDPFKTPLVVADSSRGKGTICLAVSPKMKELGVRNRCRVFEIPENIKFIEAKPRMNLYIEYSANIYAIYLKYISKDDIYVYSIDECFLDVTNYLSYYQVDEITLAKRIIQDIYDHFGITATAGIGTNLFLAKVALDVLSKHSPDNIGILDVDSFKDKIWFHEPITDIWNIGPGTAKRLRKYGVTNLYGITKLKKETLQKEFGINFEILLDHANGIEPCTIKEIHDYIPENNSLSLGQVLFSDYEYDKALLVMKEMAELLSLDLVDKGLVTNGVSLRINYSSTIPSERNGWQSDSTGGMISFDMYTNSYKKIREALIQIFKEVVDKNKLIRGIHMGFTKVIDEAHKSYDLFTDENALEKELKMSKTILEIKKKYGKNAILKGMNLEEGATTIMRNKLIGGHNAEDIDD